ncbi:hypothetical protein [Streptomyces sp. AM8-1-1]|uniref:hypothetical protein n=1 Tax=Streptomyces sp. AM8-1-1 TaxID=3075825 RepID=UPI0028C41EE4|nr:hypothetical protein [Streptomyces sp. AM8-1-1]WNO71290.1 hypothetical protein RPQ07_06485 [Streptomyces sp. AM8-1-1]
MYVFRCRRCHAEVTGPVQEVALPDVDEAPAPYALPDGQEECPQRMAAGCFAFEPPPQQSQQFVPVSERRAVVIPRKAKVQGVLVNQGDVRDLVRSTVRGRLNGCCGLDGCDGPNLVCRFCTADIAVERSDCWTPQEVVLVAGAVEFVLAPAQ